MEFRPSSPDTIGMELELQLLDAGTLDLADGILPLMRLYPSSVYVKPEVIQNTVEIASKVCGGVAELEAHVRDIAAGLRTRCAGLGMRLCGAGSHSFSVRPGLITPQPRYLAMERRYGHLSHAQITFATHVHVGMRSGDETVSLMHRMKPYLPLLIAVSASSPFWQGLDTGFASYRHRILAVTRSYGVPPSFVRWEDFCRFFETTRRAGLFGSVHDIHWDLRPRPHIGTLEVRAMDAQATVGEAAALAAFVRALVEGLRSGELSEAGLPQPLPWWIEKENHFAASRLGLAARYIADEAGTVRDLGEVWHAVYAALVPVAARLGEGVYLERLRAQIEAGPGYVAQRREYERTASLNDVVARLVDRLEREPRGEATTA
ncbi:carboxylate-amine ligase [Sulfurifustis variabilis]|uniref:Putative glutamate--cysteine ligase 2 n=1 Tax=Sulfurifustis variabilis TaxID=1675686 RepID=A0A1B4V2Q2_9GAMM|nr:YbdK family carboxylate-amine ligase [Sulfurifustis variabilis]BAU47823.1 carboxylate-amine ligase [Sulfurifustis variabilis]